MTTLNLDELRTLLPDEVDLITDPATMGPFLRDSAQVPEDADPPKPAAVVIPRTTEHVATSVKFAYDHELPVSIWAAGTGLAGGALPYEGGLVIAMHQMNSILEVDADARLATVQAGVIVQDLDSAVRKYGLFYAPDPASSARATIGGTIATNAGGLRCIAYGTTADHVAALTVVLADGSVISTGSRTIKNATGLNLTQLFVGSEGTLGIITKATVWLTPIPQGTPETFLASFDSIDDAGRAVVSMVKSAAELEVLEMLDATVTQWVEEDNHAGLAIPQAALIIGMAVGENAARSVDIACECAEHAGASEVRRQPGDGLMAVRKLSLPALQKRGVWVQGDTGVPVPRLPELIAKIEDIAEEEQHQVRIVAHVGDGNLHPMIEVVDNDWDTANRVTDRITAAAIELDGVISGEHGIGIFKHHELPMQFDEATLAAQHAIKKALDPKGILSPGRAI
ncbi:FAD-binding oxidoreductase [Corynebacterium poyangense]|nr:FAD-linked oxidase C-terminal domain-containing protein [Corynebacterium poyangense]